MANPFMVTSNECYGMSLPEASKRASYVSPVGTGDVEPQNDCSKGRGALPGIDATANPSTNHQDLSFLYSRESDRFGGGTTFSDSSLSQVFRLKESDSMSKRRKDSIFVRKQLCENTNDAPPASSSSKTVSKEEAAEILAAYEHNPKSQNPLYATTANEYGLKRPMAATIPAARHGVSQRFSQSFNMTMFRDEGLNASMTKSNIHDMLTPQFV